MNIRGGAKEDKNSAAGSQGAEWDLPLLVPAGH